MMVVSFGIEKKKELGVELTDYLNSITSIITQVTQTLLVISVLKR